MAVERYLGEMKKLIPVPKAPPKIKDNSQSLRYLKRKWIPFLLSFIAFLLLSKDKRMGEGRKYAVCKRLKAEGYLVLINTVLP